MPRSVEFLIHYPPCDDCGYTWASGDRFPLNEWHCPRCGYRNRDFDLTAHLNLMGPEERRKFAGLLRMWAEQAYKK